METCIEARSTVGKIRCLESTVLLERPGACCVVLVGLAFQLPVQHELIKLLTSKFLQARLLNFSPHANLNQNFMLC